MTHYDITIGDDVTRDVQYDIIMGCDVAMGTYHDVTMNTDVAMTPIMIFLLTCIVLFS